MLREQLLITVFVLICLGGHAQFVLNGDAIDLGGDCYQLTPALPTSSGAAWYPDLIDLTADFTISTKINLGSLDFSGADGIAFVLQPISTTLGGGGGGMGYLGISPSIDIEFDTYQNGGFGDPATDHVAINSNGVTSHLGATALSPPVNILGALPNAEDGTYHDIIFNWDVATTTLSVTVDCIPRTSYTGDIVSTIFGGNPMVYFGFTAGTGALFNVQSVCFDYLQISLPPEVVSACEGELVTLQAPAGFSGYSWSPVGGLDDPTSATPSLIASTSTAFAVTFTDICGNVFVDSVQLDVAPLPVVDLGTDTVLCGSETLDLFAPSGSPVISWSDGSSGSMLTVSAPGIYWLESGVAGCSAVDSIEVEVFDPVVDLGPDVSICDGTDVTIGVPATSGWDYSWNTGELSALITVTGAGIYELTVTESICSVADQIEVTVQNLPTVFLPDSISWCPDAETVIQVSGDAAEYHWSTGETGLVIAAQEPGLIWVEGLNGTCISRDTTKVYESIFCYCNPILPNAFTPNGDGLNDVFFPLNVSACPFADGYSMEIYNRIGERLFYAADPLMGWDGTFQGKAAELGTYIYSVVFRYEGNPEKTQLKGSVTIIR